MDISAPRIDCTGATPPIGYRRFHPDVSINFQCNRWVQWIGASAIDEVTELAAVATTYPELIDAFLALAEQARAADRAFAGAYYDRAAEFFMTATDPRRPGARTRFLEAMRTIYDVAPDFVLVPVRRFARLRPATGPPDRGSDRHVRRIRQLRRRVPADDRRLGRRGPAHRRVRGSGPGQRTRGLRPHDDPRVGAAGGRRPRPLRTR